MEYLLASLFLPLFPQSMIFNLLFSRLEKTAFQLVLLVVWPAAGIFLVSQIGDSPPHWLVYWAASTAFLYAFRSLVMRELNRWTAYIATSLWSLLWVLFLPELSDMSAWPVLFALEVPLVLLLLVSYLIKQRFGGVYAGAVHSLANTVPRLSLLLVVTILAVISTPLFPGFFALLGMLNKTLSVVPVIAAIVLITWFVWSWSGFRMIQGLIVGPGQVEQKADIETSVLAGLLLSLSIYVMLGFGIAGGLL